MTGQPSKLTKEEQKTKALETSAAKEKIYTLVSKVISWNTQSKDSNSMQSLNKITAEEWQRYKKHLLEISKTDSVEVVKEKIKKIYSTIQQHQGFK